MIHVYSPCMSLPLLGHGHNHTIMKGMVKTQLMYIELDVIYPDYVQKKVVVSLFFS